MNLVHDLTDREIEILHLLGRGETNREIGLHLSIAPDTVKWYNKRIFSKLAVNNRTAAVSQAQKLGLLGPADPEMASREASPTRHNLPAPLTSFVGRELYIRTLSQRLRQQRLLTITGPAGSGKTRLALQAATTVLSEFSDGVFFVPLAPLSKPDQVVWAIAKVVGFQFQPPEDALEQVLGYFKNKEMLLILDNFEHLISGAGVLVELLRAAPRLKILVTSRERLNLYGEALFAIAGLRLPLEDNSRSIPSSEALTLFLDRARAVNPRLALNPEAVRGMARICRLVAGLPLAIELAATWVDVLSSAEIAAEIEQNLDILNAERRHNPFAQNNMRATFDRSWNLLDEAQKKAFRRLSVFRGEFTRSIARDVCAVELSELQALVAKSLLYFDPETGRFGLHELLRQYAREQLERSGEAGDVTESFAGYFAESMAACWQLLKGGRQQETLAEMDVGFNNARAAYRYWVQRGDARRLRQFFPTLWVYFDIHAWYPAGIDLFEEGVVALRAAGTKEARRSLGWLLAVQGLFNMEGNVSTRKGFALAQEGVEMLDILRQEGDMVIPLICLFLTASQVDEHEIAGRAARRCLDIAERHGDTWGVAKARQMLALHLIHEGSAKEADAQAREALDIFNASNDLWSKSIVCIEVLGLLAVTRSRYKEARQWLETGLAAAEAIHFKYAMQMANWQLGYVAALEQDYGRAGRCWERALAIGERVVGPKCLIGYGGSVNTGEWEWGGRRLVPG